MTEYTDDELVARYIQLRDAVKKLADQHAEILKPYAEGMKAIENIMLARLIERKADNTSTPHGTAFRERTMSVQCEDKDAFLNWCFDKFDAWGKDMLTANVGKDTLRLYIDKTKDEANPQGQLPPGVKVTYGTVVRFRK